MSLLLHTTGAMRLAKLYAVTSAATGYPGLNALDDNLNTYWKPSSTANQTFDIDLQSALTINRAFFFLKNYKVGITGVSALWSSPDGSSWTQRESMASILDITTPLRIFDGISISARYWRITIGNQSPSVVFIAGFWVGLSFTIGQAHELPESNIDRFDNQAIALPGGQIAVNPLNNRSSKVMSRDWHISGTANWNALRNAHQDSKGILRPLIIDDDWAKRLVRFADDTLDDKQEAYQYYKPSVRFEQIPYIDSGESY